MTEYIILNFITTIIVFFLVSDLFSAKNLKKRSLTLLSSILEYNFYFLKMSVEIAEEFES